MAFHIRRLIFLEREECGTKGFDEEVGWERSNILVIFLSVIVVWSS
jgi:hypothetical protein